MTTTTYPSNDTLYESAKKKVMTKLMPLLLFAYFMAFIDRTNVALAKQELELHAGIDATAFGLGAGLFFITYALFEVPANMMLRKLGARTWIALIAIVWGIFSVMLMFTNSPMFFYIMRMLIGAAEAGLFPAILYLITRWFAQSDRAKITGLVLATAAFASVVSAPLGGLLLSLNGLGNMHGFQWLFFLEGIPAVLIGILIYLKLPNGPEDAKWLTADERQAVITATGGAEQDEHESIKAILSYAFSRPLLLVVSIIYVMNLLTIYGVTFFGPSIIFAMGVKSPLIVGLLVGVISIGAAAGAIIMPRLLAKFPGEARLIAIATVATLITALIFLFVPNPVVRVGILSVMMFFATGAQPLYWSSLMSRLSGATAAMGLAFVNTIGQLGAFTGPSAFGLIESKTGDANAPIWVIVVGMIIALTMIPLMNKLLKQDL